MKKFTIKLLAFITTFLVFYGFPAYYLTLSGEAFFNIDTCVEHIVKNDKQLLIGFSLDGSLYRPLKAKTIHSIDKQDVIALGSSRVLQFRQEMFNSKFYNAGSTVRSIRDFQLFLSLLPPKKMPDTLIIGLDQWMFNEAFDDLKSSFTRQDYQNNTTESLGSFTKKSWQFYKEYFNGRINIDRVYSGVRKPVGLNAFLKSSGFRNDGSFLYGLQIEKLSKGDPSANDFEFSNTFERIKEGNRRFQPCQEVNVKALKSLETFLAYCKSKNIKVVSFLPPLANAVFDEMQKSDRYIHLNLLPKVLTQIFDKYDYEFYNYNNLHLSGSSDSEAIDGFHGSEKTYLRIIIDMLKNGSVLNKHCNLLELESVLKRSNNNFMVY